MSDAQASDYTKEVNKQIEKAFGGKNLSSREDKAKIEELQQELKQWKPEEKPEKPQFQAKNSLSVNSNLPNFKKPKI